MLDQATLLFVLLALSSSLATCALALRASLPRSIRGLGTWSIALLLFGTSACAQWQIGPHAPDVALLVSGVLYVGGAGGLMLAIRRYLDLPDPWGPLLGGGALCVGIAAVAIFVVPSEAARVAALMLFTATSYCHAVQLLWPHAGRRRALGMQMLSGAMLFLAFSALLRAVLALFGDTEPAAMLAGRSGVAQAFLVASCVGILLATFGLLVLSTDRLRQMFEHLATHDPLTGLPSRAGFEPVAKSSAALARRNDRPLAYAVVDIDHFKRVNDAHGHQAGDRALVAVADALRATIRDSDVASRFGGEEFNVLIADADIDGAMRVAERLRHAIESMALEHAGQPLQITVSIGIASACGAQIDLERLYARADRALYVAKRAGRNRVEAAVPETPAETAAA